MDRQKECEVVNTLQYLSVILKQLGHAAALSSLCAVVSQLAEDGGRVL